MSNSNNPFLPHLTEENDNDNQNNNKVKDNNDISKILEEGSASAVPPPSYDEIVKPQRAQPGSEYPAYPPPPFSPSESENYNQSNQSPNPAYPLPPFSSSESENYNQSNQSPNVYMNSNNFKEKRGRRACCCFGSSKGNKTCGCGWMVVLIIFIILGIVSMVNNRVCNSLTLGGTPENFTFDPSIFSTFQINTDDARIRSGAVKVIQQSQGNFVNVQVYTGSSGITPKFDQSSQNDIFKLTISQTGFSIFNIPPRCMILQANINLPQQSLNANTIKSGNLDLVMSQQDNPLPYQQNVTLSTNHGNIFVSNLTAQTLNLSTNDGVIRGSIVSISNQLNIRTINGDTRLSLGNAQSHINSKVSVNTIGGDVALSISNGSFSGSYSIQTDGGRIRVGDQSYNNHRVTGTVNNGNGTINIVTSNGDVDIEFQGA